MSKVIVRRYQKCDFCHQEYEVDLVEIENVRLPCDCVSADGYRTRTAVNLSICQECSTRLYNIFSKEVHLEEIEYAGVVCEWRGVQNGE